MDCVGCDKCRLWGKVQTKALGTALKILFSGDSIVEAAAKNNFYLSRSEIVSLFNGFARYKSYHIKSFCLFYSLFYNLCFILDCLRVFRRSKTFAIWLRKNKRTVAVVKMASFKVYSIQKRRFSCVWVCACEKWHLILLNQC